jgi:hypothetical protein
MASDATCQSGWVIERDFFYSAEPQLESYYPESLDFDLDYDGGSFSGVSDPICDYDESKACTQLKKGRRSPRRSKRHPTLHKN